MTNDDPDAPQLAQDITASMADLVPGFLDERRRDVVAISAAVEHGDLETVRILGRSMKGSGGGYGFDLITRIGAALEEAATQGHTGEIRGRNAQLQRYLVEISTNSTASIPATPLPRMNSPNG